MATQWSAGSAVYEIWLLSGIVGWLCACSVSCRYVCFRYFHFVTLDLTSEATAFSQKKLTDIQPWQIVMHLSFIKKWKDRLKINLSLMVSYGSRLHFELGACLHPAMPSSQTNN